MTDETLQQDGHEIAETEGEEIKEARTPEVEGQQEEVAEDAGLVVEIGGEEPEEPEHFKEVRRKYREAQKRLKELEARVVTTPEQETLPPEPEMEDYDYDAAAFKVAHREWLRKADEHEKRQEQAKELQVKAEQRWQTRLAYYDEGKEKLGVQDYDDAEATVSEVLSTPFPGIMAEDVRIGIIKQGAKDPAALVYALAKNPAKAKELAEIDDPVEFAWKAATLEASMKVVRGKAPPPEKRISGGVPGVAGALDNTLERLREEAAKTGDYSKVSAYKRQQRG
jgi:hypothetical protein